MSTHTYSQKLRDPRWQKKRLLIYERDGFRCRYCYSADSTLNVHHLYYEKGMEPWESNDESLITLCDNCHEHFQEQIPQELNSVRHSLQEKLKSPFIASCAATFFKKFNHVHDLIYLLWELMDKEDLILEFLTKEFQKDVALFKKEITLKEKVVKKKISKKPISETNV